MAALDEISVSPQLDDFTLLQEHEAQTPGTFFHGKPVLHYYACKTYINLPLAAHQRYSAFRILTCPVADTAPQNIRIEDIDVWVTDQRLILYSQTENRGCRIPYPAIGITAIDKNTVLLEMSICTSEDTADDDIEHFQVKIGPMNFEYGTHLDQQTATTANGTNGTTPSKDMIASALYEAIADCQELNPDPPSPGFEGENGESLFDETAPGASGWITSGNMDQYLDADGNFKMPEVVTFVGGEDDEAVNSPWENGVQEPLGDGAGRTRTATEAGVEMEDESKWRATGGS